MSDYELSIIEGELAHVLGDSDTTALTTSALAELLKGAGTIAATKQAKDEKKVADDKAKLTSEAASKQAQAAAEAAMKARTAATIAQQRAMGEADPYGPLHLAAIQADADARALEMKAGGGSYGMMPYGQQGRGAHSSGDNFLTRNAGGLPVYGWVLIGLAGVGVTYAAVKYAGRR